MTKTLGEKGFQMDMIAMWFGTRLKTERKQVSHVI